METILRIICGADSGCLQYKYRIIAAGASHRASAAEVVGMSVASEDLVSLVSRGLSEIASIKPVDDGLIATTHCMYPSNGLVQVRLRGGNNTIIASDEGGALGEATSAGIPVHDRALAQLVKDQGLFIRENLIFSPKMPIEAAPLAILLVANASQEVARWLFDHTKIKRTRNFKDLLTEFLLKRFDNRVSHAAIAGHSLKLHKVSNVIELEQHKRLIIDPVANEPSSINARVVANLDVKAVNDPLIIQRLVYDDEDDWAAADLNLLQVVGAPVVPFSRLSEVIERIAA
jgi:hypothetical protein